MNGSLTTRVAWAAAGIACASALLSALATGLLSALLLQDAEDRRLGEAAVILAAELGGHPDTPAEATAIVREESEETGHAGLVLGVLDAQGKQVAGDPRLGRWPVHAAAAPGVAEPACTDLAGAPMRACGVATPAGAIALVAGPQASPGRLLGLAALLATFLAALGAWLASKPLSRAVVAPLARLRARLSALDIDAPHPQDLGRPEGVAEVDQLRATIAELLERGDRAIALAQRFAANAAHELRTPLTSLRGELELLLERPDLAADTRAPLAHVERKTAELSQLVERLLVLATPVGAPAAAGEAVSLRDLAEDAIAASVERDASVEGDAVVEGDATLLAVMVGNAISNAAKFGTQVRVAITADASNARLTVQDDGPGIPAADRERIFEPFTRGTTGSKLAPTASAGTAGHGLGLALVRHIAATHRGDAHFIDCPRGACLQLTLPLSPGLRGPGA